MANNQLAEGEQITIVAPYACTKGNIVLFGNAFGVALDNANSAANVVLDVSGGVWQMTKVSGASTSIALGGYVYWDNTNSKVTVSASSNTKIGVATVAATNADVNVSVRVQNSF